ncbi:MAG: transporter [Verrucomicrobia bacterium]|nr:transporter [Verrucomicrobiota bacterium]
MWQRPAILTWLCYGGMASLAIGLNLLPLFLAELGATYGGETGLTREELGRLGSMMFAGLVLGIVVTGPLADRWAPKPFVLFGCIVTSASLGAAAVAPTYGFLGASLVFLGLGAGMLDMMLSPVVAALNPHRRIASLNWLHSFYSIGAVVTIGAGTIIQHGGFKWRYACLAFSPLPAALAVAFAFMEFPPLTGAAGRMAVRDLLRQPWFRAALMALFLVGAVEIGVAQWLPTYAEKELHYPTWVGGVAFMVFSIAMAGGRMILGLVVKRLDPYIMLISSGGVCCLLVFAGALLPTPALSLTACVAVGLAVCGLWPTVLALAGNRFPEGGASMFGILSIFGNAGGIGMPWLVGWVASHYDLRWGIAVVGIATLPLILSLLSLRTKEVRAESIPGMNPT